MKYILLKPREANRNFLFSVVLMTIKMLLFVILLISLSGAGALAGVCKAWVDTAPDLDLAAIGAQSQTSFIYDSTGNLIMEFKGSENRIYVELEDIPQQLINAVVAIEDSRFYEHHGVDLKRIVGAMVNNLTGGQTQGASTITCQLVKLTLLDSGQNYKRKMQEAYLALELEKNLTKDQIMEAYLNVIYLGGSSYGVKIAAQDYFGKDLKDLTLRECACLARIIRNPWRYNPRRNYYVLNTPDEIEKQTNYVLEQMLDQELITPEEYAIAHDQERLHVVEKSTAVTESMYDNAYYVEYSIYDVVTKMLRVEGLEDTRSNRSAMETKLRNGGYKVFTSLNPEIQQAVQDVITNWRNYPAMRYTNDSTTQASLGGGEYLTVVQPQACAAVMNWHTGELVAVVGGRSEPVQRKQTNRAYQNGNMPVGSSLKPLAVYGPAFDMGYSPGTPVLNLPIPIKDWVSEKGFPTNYGGGSYTGVESMRSAINKSHNTSTAHTLMDYVGIENAVTYLLKLGVNPDHILATGSGLALGSSGVSVIELATAFGAIANRGVYQESYAFTQILNPDGTVYIDVNEVQETWEAFKPSTAYMLVDVLKGCVGPDGTGQNAVFGNMTIAGKTGTNTNNIGVTFAGMTGYYSAAVWIGSDYYKPLSTDATGGAYAAPLWGEIMRQVHIMTGCTTDRTIIAGTPADYNLVACTVCSVSGMLPTVACRNDANWHYPTTDYYLNGTQPTASCNMHRAVTVCMYSRKVAAETCANTRVFGLIYIPEGHPLRYAEQLEDVTEYFAGASTNESATSLGRCNLGR